MLFARACVIIYVYEKIRGGHLCRSASRRAPCGRGGLQRHGAGIGLFGRCGGILRGRHVLYLLIRRARRRRAVQRHAACGQKDGDRQYLNVYSRNGDAGTFISALGGSFVPTLVEGTTDVYRTRISLSNSMLEQDKVHLLLRDYAHNETSVTIHPSSLNTIVVSNDIDNTYDFAFSRLSASGGYITYLFEVYQNGVPADGFDSPVTLYLYYGEDFDLSTFYLEIDGVEVTPSYDAETGYVSITFEPIDGASTIVVNVEPSEVVTPDNPDHGDDDDNTSGNSSSTPNTGDSSSTPGENPEPEDPSTSEGLPAWAIALIVVGSLVVVGGVVALVIVLTKKKK